MEPVIRKCEFCETTLKSDREVSLHLNPKLQKNTYRSISDVYKALRLRAVRDVRELADIDYFKIPDDEASLSRVMRELSTVLLNSIAEHITKNLPDKGQALLSILYDTSKQDEKNSDAHQADLLGGPEESEPMEVDVIQSPTQERPLNPVSGSVTNVQTTITQFCTNSSQVANATVGSLSRNAGVNPREQTLVAPNLTSSQPKVSDRSNKETRTGSSSSRSHSRSTDRSDNRLNPRDDPARKKKKRPRADGQHRESQPKSSGSRTETQNRGSTSRIVSPQSSRRQHSSGSDTNSADQSALRNSVSVPAHITPMSGAHLFIPRPADHDKPQPRQDSTYKPQLAKVKVEPKDD